MAAVDLEKRKRVMQRSIRLGHCICDPKKACPCDLLREKDVCLCAGEVLEAAPGPVRLTTLVESAGCASKIDQASLKRVLAGLPALDDPRVLVGSAAGDDAGVFELDERTLLVQTVDVFTPSVDDPYTFGRIAAANSLSDVYAMGGRPLTALSIVGFPIRSVRDEALREILRGGLDTMAEAGVPVIGGHSIKDPEVKAGFAVTGLVEREAMKTNAGARPGDVLVLTKPIGTGVLAFATQIGRVPEASARAVAESMATLNRRASELMVELDAHAATDVTGFGLMGHLAEMARASGVDVEVTWDAIPVFPGLLECLADGIVPGGIERNRESSEAAAIAGAGVTPEMMDVCFDPQTSGGLLVALAPEAAERFVAKLHEEGIRAAAIVGRVRAKGSGEVHVMTTGERSMPEPTQRGEQPAPAPEPAPAAEACCAGGAAEEACCAPAGSALKPEAPAPRSSKDIGDAEAAFRAFMAKAGSPGALDVATKQAMNIALSVLAKCRPCLMMHVKKARGMGFSEAEIEEAAWMGIAFGGSPVMMFYKETMKELG